MSEDKHNLKQHIPDNPEVDDSELVRLWIGGGIVFLLAVVLTAAVFWFLLWPNPIDLEDPAFIREAVSEYDEVTQAAVDDAALAASIIIERKPEGEGIEILSIGVRTLTIITRDESAGMCQFCWFDAGTGEIFASPDLPTPYPCFDDGSLDNERFMSELQD